MRHRSRWLSVLLAFLPVICMGPSLRSQAVGTAAQAPDPNPELRNFDARVQHNLGYAPTSSSAQSAAIESMRRDIRELDVTLDERTGATRSLFNRLGYLTAPRSGLSPVEIGVEFVRANLDALGLGPADIADYETTDVAFNQTTGATHIYLRQVYRGLPVYNGQLQLNVNRDGRILSVNNAFHPDIAGSVQALEPRLGADSALLSVATRLGITNAPLPRVVSSPEGVRQATLLDAPGIATDTVRASLMLLSVRRGDVRLVWNLQMEAVIVADHRPMFDLTVDAVSGEVWTQGDWVSSDQYKVYALPVESPNHTSPLPPADGRTTPLNPANATASPFGWHDTNGAAGAEYTILRGNNAHAYEDTDNNNLPPVTQPDCGVSLNCSFPIDLTLAPSAYIPAAVANLFYWNNIVHDVQYQYGFTEAGGNFQVNNYGRGGAGNDDVQAEAQDGGSVNNANFATPPDGSRPRMQMYTWNLTAPGRDGDLDAGIMVHEYGHGISNRLVGGPSNVSCLANLQQPGEGLSDWWALVYTAKPGDVGTTGRGVGTYALGQPTTGLGIRTQRYSTDSAVNTWTYASISGMAIPHGVGSVWAQGMWEVFWALVNTYGLSADLYNATGGAGNQRAMLYVNAGLQNTVCSPAFTDVRNGIIQAAVDNYGGADVCPIWSAFAAFGLGVDGISGGPNGTTPTNGFGVPAACLPGAPTISVNDVSVSEGTGGTSNLQFTASLSAPFGTPVYVDFATADGTAKSNTTANFSSISIPSSGNATPYPSTIFVPASLSSLTLTKVTATLKGFGHTWPRDVDVLLVGPGGQSVVLMSDVGSSIDAVNLNFTFDDTGPPLGSGTLASGTYSPTNIADNEGGDVYSSPAPAGPYGSTLSVFNGTSPAGTWSLYVVDDVLGDSGSFSGGWQLNFTPSPPQDYLPASGTLTFTPTVTSMPVNVTIVGDATFELNETFALNLSNPGNATIADGQGVGTILNDDAGIFTDDPIVVGSTPVKLVHVTELHDRIDAQRLSRGLSVFAWTDPAASGNVVLAVHIAEMRTALGQAFVAAGLTSPVYTDPALSPGVTPVKAIHLTELRANVQTLEAAP